MFKWIKNLIENGVEDVEKLKNDIHTANIRVLNLSVEHNRFKEDVMEYRRRTDDLINNHKSCINNLLSIKDKHWEAIESLRSEADVLMKENADRFVEIVDVKSGLVKPVQKLKKKVAKPRKGKKNV